MRFGDEGETAGFAFQSSDLRTVLSRVLVHRGRPPDGREKALTWSLWVILE